MFQDDINGELYFDTLEDTYSNLDLHPSCYVNIRNFTFSSNEPLLVFWDPDQVSSDLHGKRIYCHVLGADVWVFVTKSEDHGSLPYDYAFWVNHFHQENVLRHIYQGVLDYAAWVSISSLEVHDALEPTSPCGRWLGYGYRMWRRLKIAMINSINQIDCWGCLQ